MPKFYSDIAMVERRIAALTAAQARDAGLRRYVAIRASTIEPLAFDPDGSDGYSVRAVYLESATRFRTSAEARQAARAARMFAEDDGAKICLLAHLYEAFLRCLKGQLQAARPTTLNTSPAALPNVAPPGGWQGQLFDD